MDTERWIAKLEAEEKALKQAFQQSALKLDVITKNATFSPSRNAITTTYSGGSSTTNDVERFIVTFNTSSGSNTLATLELSTDSTFLPRVRRLPHTGGVKWMVTAESKDRFGTWSPTNYVATVESVVDGSISFSEVSS